MEKLQIINHNNTLVVDSRDVAKWVDKRHDHLCRDIAGYSNIISNAPNLGAVDFFIPSTYTDAKGESRKNYLVTRKGCDMVANKLIGTKGVIFTAEYINRFHEYEKQLMSAKRKPDSYTIDDPIERAERWIEEAKERKALAATVSEQSKQLEEQRPKVEFADTVTKSCDNIYMKEMAKLIADKGTRIGEKRLFATLRNKKVLMPNNNPYQAYIDRGYFVVKESVYKTPYGVELSRTTLVTPKGQIWLVSKTKEWLVPKVAEVV